MKNRIFSLLLSALVLLASCDSKKNGYDPYSISGGKGKAEVSKASFEVPFKKIESNLKTIHINLNGKNSYDAIFDTGCSGVSISALEAVDLQKSGTLAEKDHTNDAVITMADGSQLVQPVYNLREITVVDKNGQEHTLRDIEASIVENLGAPILIGSSVIDNLARNSYTVDLKKRVIRFE